MSKPEIKEVLAIKHLKEQAKALYEEIDSRVDDIKSEFGAGRFDYDLEKFIDEYSDNPDMELTVMGVVEDSKNNGRYLKLEIVDNVRKLQDGETVFSNVSFKPVSFQVRGLKRCPDSLK